MPWSQRPWKAAYAVGAVCMHAFLLVGCRLAKWLYVGQTSTQLGSLHLCEVSCMGVAFLPGPVHVGQMGAT